MAKENLMIRIQPEMRKALDANNPQAAYVETWQTEHVRQGLREAEAGKFVETKKVKEVLARLRSR
jgi:predicted transcriptional regulator